MAWKRGALYVPFWSILVLIITLILNALTKHPTKKENCSKHKLDLKYRNKCDTIVGGKFNLKYRNKCDTIVVTWLLSLFISLLIFIYRVNHVLGVAYRFLILFLVLVKKNSKIVFKKIVKKVVKRLLLIVAIVVDFPIRYIHSPPDAWYILLEFHFCVNCVSFSQCGFSLLQYRDTNNMSRINLSRLWFVVIFHKVYVTALKGLCIFYWNIILYCTVP